ncbi:MAG: hypothetical protein FJW23_10885 [Acidimicrobiia bacterium]|nr:hypothetical protein [Acidimicrobiia bacterium]
MTKSELITSLQNEVRILLHLAGKIEPSMLDYRPTPKQRSTLELLKYLVVMGPGLTAYALTGTFDREAWAARGKEAEGWDLKQTLAAIAGQHDQYAELLGDVSEADFRGEMKAFDGSTTSRGAFIVNAVLCGCAAYRTQLFLYLKACGRAELGTANLWQGVDPAPAPAS